MWFGSNLLLLTIVTGALAVTVFAIPFGWAVVGLVVGSLVGAIFMALHAAQSPTLGVPQMIQTRGQFGSLGSLLVVGIVIVMYVGFLSSNLVLGGEAITSIAPGLSDTPAIALVGILSVVAAIWGHDLIHAHARVMTYVSGAVLLLTLVWIIGVHGLPAGFLSRNSLSLAGLLGTVSAAVLWQFAYAPYVSDYSRYMPRDTGARSAFWASYWGCTLGSVLPMILGAMVGLAIPAKTSLIDGLAMLTHGMAPLVPIVFAVGVATANAMSPCSARTAINLADYYLLRRGRYDVPSFFRPDGGIYGRVNAVAVGCYVVGILVQLPLVATPAAHRPGHGAGIEPRPGLLGQRRHHAGLPGGRLRSTALALSPHYADLI